MPSKVVNCKKGKMLKKTLNLESKTSDKNLKSVNGDGVEGGIRSGWDRPGHVGEGVRCSGEQVGGNTHRKNM